MAQDILKTLKRGLTAFHPLLREVPLPLRAAVYSRSAVSHPHRYVYIRVPKAANSTISKTLAWLTFADERAAIEADDEGRASKRLFSSYPWGWRGPQSVPADYFKFVFVRSPFSRVLSAYLDKINPGFDRSSFAYVGAASGRRPSELSFADFVDYLEGGGLNANIHWAPQVDICPLPVASLDFIGRIETIDTDLRLVGQRIFGEPGIATQSRASGRTNSSGKLMAYYTPDLVQRVATLYARDFDAFGYSPELTPAEAGPSDRLTLSEGMERVKGIELR